MLRSIGKQSTESRIRKATVTCYIHFTTSRYQPVCSRVWSDTNPNSNPLALRVWSDTDPSSNPLALRLTLTLTLALSFQCFCTNTTPYTAANEPSPTVNDVKFVKNASNFPSRDWRTDRSVHRLATSLAT